MGALALLEPWKGQQWDWSVGCSGKASIIEMPRPCDHKGQQQIWVDPMKQGTPAMDGRAGGVNHFGAQVLMCSARGWTLRYQSIGIWFGFDTVIIFL